jgi:hypothetical protein
LLGRKDGYEFFAEVVKAVCQKNMPVQRLTAELGQNKDFPQSRMYTVAYGKIDEPESSGNGDGWFASLFGQGIEPASLPAGHDYRDYICHEIILFLS